MSGILFGAQSYSKLKEVSQKTSFTFLNFENLVK